MKLRDHNPNQDRDELTQFARWAVDNRVRSYLEIGCRFGDSLYAVMANIAHGGRAVAIDIAVDPRLMQTAAELRRMAHRIDVFAMPSGCGDMVASARERAPFDLVLIDADHTYAGVFADWQNYASFGKVVALHDVDAPDGWDSDGKPNGVGRFWRDLKAASPEKVIAEFITAGSNMGYGLWAN